MEADEHEKGRRTILNQLTLCRYFQLCSFYGHWMFSYIYIWCVCVCGVFVAMVTSVLHLHCICSLINAIKSVINHVVLCVQHHYVPSYIKYIVMHHCYGEICVQQHWFQALLHAKKTNEPGCEAYGVYLVHLLLFRLLLVSSTPTIVCRYFYVSHCQYLKAFLGRLSKRSPALGWSCFSFKSVLTVIRELLNKQYSFSAAIAWAKSNTWTIKEPHLPYKTGLDVTQVTQATAQDDRGS